MAAGRARQRPGLGEFPAQCTCADGGAAWPGPGRYHVQAAVDALHTAQRPDGSWEGDPYVAALALRASVAAGRPVTDPNAGQRARGLVSDATGPLAEYYRCGWPSVAAPPSPTRRGVLNSLQLNSRHEHPDGRCRGHLLLSADLGLLKGQRLDLGTIRLKARTVGNADTVTITGVARFTDDGASYRNAANTTIAVNGRAQRRPMPMACTRSAAWRLERSRSRPPTRPIRRWNRALALRRASRYASIRCSAAGHGPKHAQGHRQQPDHGLVDRDGHRIAQWSDPKHQRQGGSLFRHRRGDRH